jgi:GTP pyrophosphokinase/guanosine-3',5'-bis(diphosphate) 3'-pyrophosphohydrolase
VAGILTDYRLDTATIVTALLHDVIEDTPVTRKEIDELFGVEIGELVEGVTKLSKLELSSSTCARPRTSGNSSWRSPRTSAS